MRIRLVMDLSDHRRRYAAGEVVDDVPDETAQRWIAAGFAEEEHPAGRKHAPEAAAIESPEETATHPRAHRRPRG